MVVPGAMGIIIVNKTHVLCRYLFVCVSLDVDGVWDV